jgi:hypothetical protein
MGAEFWRTPKFMPSMKAKSPPSERRVSTRIDPALDYRIRRYCRAKPLGRSAVVRIALVEFIRNHPIRERARA